MQFTLEEKGGARYLRSQSVEAILNSVQDALDMLVLDYSHGTGRFLIREENFASAFYDLKTGLAGAILQKFSNYCVKAAILGGFSSIVSPPFRAFMVECNRGRQLYFAASEPEAIAWLAR